MPGGRTLRLRALRDGLGVGEAEHGAEVHPRRLPDLVEHLLRVGHAGDGDRDLVLARRLHLRAGHAEPVDAQVQDVDRLVEVGLEMWWPSAV